nr:MAG TPA: hypothetical protein [Caudoviricetes sp.]
MLQLISSDFGHCFYYCKQKTASYCLRSSVIIFYSFCFYFILW